MATELSWTTDMNRVVGGATAIEQSKWAAWYIKALLTGQVGSVPGSGQWTVYGSSDSVTADVAGTDLWGNPFDETKIVRGTAAAVRSWIALTAPFTDNGLAVHLILSYEGATDYRFLTVVGHGAISGGTTTARPTCATEFYVASTAADEQQMLVDSSGLPWKAHGTVSSTGEFHFLTSKDGTARFSGHFMVRRITDQPSGEAYSICAHRSFRFSLDVIDLANQNTSYNWDATSLSGQAIATTDPSGAMAYIRVVKYSVQGSGLAASATWNVTSSGEKMRLPAFWCRGTTTLWFGRLPDVFLGSNINEDGDVTPASGGIEYIAAGSAWLPFGAAPSL